MVDGHGAWHQTLAVSRQWKVSLATFVGSLAHPVVHRTLDSQSYTLLSNSMAEHNSFDPSMFAASVSVWHRHWALGVTVILRFGGRSDTGRRAFGSSW
jgi:hypothetical protein